MLTLGQKDKDEQFDIHNFELFILWGQSCNEIASMIDIVKIISLFNSQIDII
jgi:hypothetical protein